MHKVLFDWNNNAIVPDGFIVIDTEVDFLEKAISGQPLFIRGQRLCKWAQDFFDGRGIEYKNAPSPIHDLMEIFTGISDEQAGVIFQMCGDNFLKLEKITAPAILGSCYQIHLWDAIPSVYHAAEWLIWLDQRDPDVAFQPIIKEMINQWNSLTPEFAEIYECRDADSARSYLEKWLCAENPDTIKKFGEFPLPVSDKWIGILEKSWRKKVVETNGQFIDEFIKRQTIWKFKHIVAMITLDYFEQSPASLSTERYNQIARFVSGDDRDRLNVIKPVLIPGDIPNTAESVLVWFAKEYLPFREWQMAAKVSEVYPRVLDLGDQFAKWYLNFYPTALTSKRYLSFFKSKELKNQASGYVDLLIILDGLHALDAKYFKDCILNDNSGTKLTITDDSLCFAPLPTVTDFAKGALIHGVQPTIMEEFEKLGEDVSEQKTPLPKLQTASPGSLFIWKIQEPDRVYHGKNKFETLKAEVEGELSKTAQKILDIAKKLPMEIPLRITITTDHGRFLGMSERKISVPSGMQAHGRAAWGRVQIDFDKTGYKIDGDLVYLSKERFGLKDDDAAVILTDQAFEHEKYDQEFSTHGGLFPEEVIIPWMVFERNVTRPDLEFKLSGEGQANLPGKALISIVNPSSINLTLARIEIITGGDIIPIEIHETVSSLRKTNLEFEIPSWPSSDQRELGYALAILKLPSGEEISAKLPLDKLEIIELYTRDKSLFEGLDL